VSEVNGSKLLVRGARVDLGDGVERRVIFDFEALLLIEERCGSIHAYLDGLAKGTKGRLLRSLSAGLAGGLAHDPVSDARIRAALMASMKRGYDHLQPYVDALDGAWEEAHHLDEAPAGKDSAPESGSPGPTSTEGALSTLAGQTPSSGA
jgi:hypothetical protein